MKTPQEVLEWIKYAISKIDDENSDWNFATLGAVVYQHKDCINAIASNDGMLLEALELCECEISQNFGSITQHGNPDAWRAARDHARIAISKAKGFGNEATA